MHPYYRPIIVAIIFVFISTYSFANKKTSDNTVISESKLFGNWTYYATSEGKDTPLENANKLHKKDRVIWQFFKDGSFVKKKPNGMTLDNTETYSVTSKELTIRRSDGFETQLAILDLNNEVLNLHIAPLNLTLHFMRSKLVPEEQIQSGPTQLQAKLSITLVPRKNKDEFEKSLKEDNTEELRVDREWFTAAILLSNCTLNEEGRCNVNAKIESIDPNGQISILMGRSFYSRLRVCKNKVPPATGDYLFSETFELRYKDDRPSGVYTMMVTVYDVNSSEEITLEKKLLVD